MSKLEFFSSNLGQRFFWEGVPPRNIQQWDFQCKTLIQNVFYVTDVCVVKYPREKVTRFWAFKPHPGGIFREKDGRRAKRAFVQLFVKKWSKDSLQKQYRLVGMLERLVPGALERKSLGQNDQSPGE